MIREGCFGTGEHQHRQIDDELARVSTAPSGSVRDDDILIAEGGGMSMQANAGTSQHVSATA